MLEAYVLNTSFDIVSPIDIYESFIWTERYFEAGDFELYLPLLGYQTNLSLLQHLVRDNYIVLKESNIAMIIEEVQIDTDVEKGVFATITGRSLKSLLERRIVWKEFDFSGSLQNGIKKLVTDNVISPSDEERKIPGFIFRDSTDIRITSMELETYLYGENLYEAIVSICTDNNIGFRVTLENGQFVFELYKGLDRTYDQEVRPYVVFSPEFDNILTSTYYETNTGVKNCILVSNDVPAVTTTETKSIPYITDNHGTQYITYQEAHVTPAYKRKVEVKSDSYLSGIHRRELFLDTNVSDTDEDGNELTDAEKEAQMRTAGSEELAETNITVAFDASVEPSRQFIYGVDFFIGDVVQVKNEYGYESKARITELIRSKSTSGESVNPTFTVIENLE